MPPVHWGEKQDMALLHFNKWKAAFSPPLQHSWLGPLESIYIQLYGSTGTVVARTILLLPLLCPFLHLVPLTEAQG